MIMLSANKLLGKWQKISFAGASIRVLFAPTKNPDELGSQKGQREGTTKGLAALTYWKEWLLR